MTPSDDPHPERGVPSSPPGAATESVTILPPPPQLASPSPDAGRNLSVPIRLLEALLIVGGLALAFLLALLPARNSDVWLHLASGRLLAHGQYQFGIDPFAFTTQGVSWVNPSWLYDLLSFYLFQLGDGAALVIAKAGLTALLGWILICLGCTKGDHEKGENRWVAIVFAVFALLIIGSAVPLRPVCVSYVFLALTLWLLERRLTGDRPASLASWWPVLLLFALWANLDEWFVLGPLTVGLYFLGTLLAGRERLGQARTLGLVLLAGSAACLLNPHHYHVFALPSLLPFTTEATILRDDPLFSRFLQSPFQRDYLRFQDLPHLGRLLYYPLVFLSFASFLPSALVARSGGARTLALCFRRLPVLLFFLGLSAVDASAVSFMAIAAAPLTALNIQEFARWRGATRSPMSSASPLWSIGGRILTLAVVIGLLIAAWPGWLQGQLRGPRGWFVEMDTSLVEAVRQVTQWRHEGRLHPAEVGFNFSPTAAHYFAWFASEEEKSFCDTRWRLCAGAAPDYVTVRSALLSDSSALERARRILRERQIAYLVLHDSDVQATAAVFQRLVTAPGEWPILFLRGDTIVFGWRDPALGAPSQAHSPDRFARWSLDFHQRAFRPAEEDQAPARGAEPGPDPTDWKSYWTTATSAPSHARDEAALYLIYFDMLRPMFLVRHRAVWELGLAAAIVAGAPELTDLPRQFVDFAAFQVSRDGPEPPVNGGIRPLDFLAMQVADNHFRDQDDGPPGVLLLAVRAARRAIKENPHDARAYQLLGEAYLHLNSKTRERAWQRDLPSLTHVRQIQSAVTLHRALLLQPGLIQAHYRLYELYREMRFLDLALQQLRQIRGLTPAQGSTSTEDRMKQELERLDAEVRKRQDRFENQAIRASVLERATRAVDNGLAGKALDILLASDVAVFGKQGTRMELDLLLTVGRIDDAREWLVPSLEAELGSDNYRSLRVKLEAAAGNYQPCDEELAQMALAIERRIPRPEICKQLGRILLDAPWQKQSVTRLLMNRLQTTEFLDHLKVFAGEIRQQAEVEALRGALGLERGDVPQAESSLRRARSIGRDTTEGAAAKGMLDWLSRP